MKIFDFTFYIKIYILLEYIVWKKVVYIITFYLQFLCVAWYTKRSNDTSKLNIHNNNYNIIEIYIKRFSTTLQIFIAMDYLIVMSEKYVPFRKSLSMWQGIFFPEKSIVEVTGSMYFGNIFGLYVSQSMYKNLKEIVIIQIKSELTIFVNL